MTAFFLNCAGDSLESVREKPMGRTVRKIVLRVGFIYFSRFFGVIPDFRTTTAVVW